MIVMRSRLRYHERRAEGLRSSPERYLDCTGRGLMGVGWGGGGNFGIVKNSQASPIKPSTTLLARPAQLSREMGGASGRVQLF